MRKIIAALFAAMVTVVGLSVPAHADTNTVTVREGDVNLSETRATGHNEFLRQGVRIWTESNTSTDKAAGYYPVNVPLDDIDSASQDWVGSEPQVSVQMVVDLGYGDDGGQPDGVPDGILVWEPVYGGNDLWLSNGSTQEFKALAEQAGLVGGGSGSNWHGTFAQWQDAVPNNTMVVNGGWSLGSGVKGAGILVSQTIGDTTYEFTSDAAPNNKPVADFEFVVGNAPMSAAFDGSASADSDGSIQSYEWDFGDGSTFGPSSSPIARHKFDTAGRQKVTLTVTDDRGATDKSVQRVYVKSAKQVARPKAHATVTQVHKSVRVKVTATQPKGTVATPKGAYYRVMKVNPRTHKQYRVAKGRVFAGDRDIHKVRFPKAKKQFRVKIISYGKVVGSGWYVPNK